MDKVVVDTGFLSTLLKAELVKKAIDILEVEFLYITPDVKIELDRCELLLSCDTENIILLEYQVTDMRDETLGLGEISCIKYCEEHGCGLLIDDRKARDLADKKGIPTLTIPDLLYLGKIKNKIDNDEMRDIIDKIRVADSYAFKKEVEDRLLDE